MLTGWWYRAASAIGTTILAMGAALTSLYATSSGSHSQPIDGTEFLLILVATGFIVGLALEPLYRPRPRNLISMTGATLARITLACVILVAVARLFGLGTLTPAMAVFTGVLLSVTLPFFYWALRRRTGPKRVLVVGDDRDRIGAVAASVPVSPVGFVSPEIEHVPPRNDRTGATDCQSPSGETTTDGGEPRSDPKEKNHAIGENTSSVVDGIDRLGGLSRFESLVCTYDIDTVVLAFSDVDRGEFFGSIRTANKYGIDVLAHESHADDVLVREGREGPLITIDVDPWPWYMHVVKRVFDVTFAAVGLLVLTPLVLAIVIAIKLDTSGPVFYKQTRTSAFGGRFHVLKFRTMMPESEDPTPQEDIENEMITPVGRILRKTHVDEIPQLWSVLFGDMSVVGPRAIWTDEERLLEATVDGWRARWHVKPGLTGLAQVNDVTSTAGHRKLELDLGYIRSHSFTLDLRIVARQIWIVLTDIVELARLRFHHWRS